MAVAVLLILSHGQYILEPDNKLPLTRHNNFPVCIMTAAPIGVCFLTSVQTSDKAAPNWTDKQLYNTIDRGYTVDCYMDGAYNKIFYGGSNLLLMNADADADIMSILGDPVDLDTVLSYLSSIGFTSVTIFDFSCNKIVTADFDTPSSRLIRALRNNVHKHSI
jgi:hypothetical protein